MTDYVCPVCSALSSAPCESHDPEALAVRLEELRDFLAREHNCHCMICRALDDAAAALRRLATQAGQAPVAGEGFPVTGRSEPREVPRVHDVQFHGDDVRFHGIVAMCAPCRWKTSLDDGHDLAYLTRIVNEHSGGHVMSLEMNPEIRALWTAALRSGEYKQGTGYLRSGDDAYCCLGVLCDLAARQGVVSARLDDGLTPCWEYDGEPGKLPEAVAEWAALDESNPEVFVAVNTRNPRRDMWDLASLNDEEHWSFTQIADAIDGGTSG